MIGRVIGFIAALGLLLCSFAFADVAYFACHYELRQDGVDTAYVPCLFVRTTAKSSAFKTTWAIYPDTMLARIGLDTALLCVDGPAAAIATLAADSHATRIVGVDTVMAYIRDTLGYKGNLRGMIR